MQPSNPTHTPGHTQDWSLLRRYVEQNSQEAFAALVARHLNLVHATCLREMGNRAQAEDVTQTVFLILARKAPTLRAGTHLGGWLFQTARFVARNARRQKMRREQYEQKAAQSMAADQSTQSDALWDRLEPFLNDAVARLPAGDREAILLRYWDDQSLAETGAALGVSEDAARKRVTRALERLRRLLGKQDGAVSDAALASLLPAHAVGVAPATLAPAIAKLTSGALAGYVNTSLASASVYQISEGALRAMKAAQLKAAAVVVAVVLAGTATYTVVRGDAANTARQAADLDKPVSTEGLTLSQGNPPDGYLNSALVGKVRYEDGRPAAGVQVFVQIQNAAMMKLLDEVMPPAGTASGGPMPVPKKEREQSGNYAVSRQDGTYTLPVGADIPYNVMVIDNTGLWVTPAAEGVSGRQHTTTHVPDLVLTKGAIVEGVVTNSLGLPIPGAAVASYGPHRPDSSAAVIGTETDQAGHYRLRVAPGRNRIYTVGVPSKFNSQYVSQNVTVAAGEVSTVNLKITEEPKTSGKEAMMTVSPDEVKAFTRNLASRVDAGQSLVSTFTALAEQQPNPHFRQVIEQINHEIQTGHTLSGAMGKYPEIFSKDYVQAVRDGEVHGNLEVKLHQLSSD